MKSGLAGGGIHYFDISHGITERIQRLDTGSRVLYNLFTYNDEPVTLWTKAYDLSPTVLNNISFFTVAAGTAGNVSVAGSNIATYGNSIKSISDLNSVNANIVFALNSGLYLTVTNNYGSIITLSGSSFWLCRWHINN